MSLKNATQNKKEYHRLHQQAYRARLKEQGYQRLEINIPMDVWRKIEPRLKRVNGQFFPGKAVVQLLSEIKFRS